MSHSPILISCLVESLLGLLENPLILIQKNIIYTLTEALAADHCPKEITSKNSGPRRPTKKRFIFPISFFNIPADLGGILG